jgi:4-hydroxy-tetrahydrodipicolinate reductase
VNKYRVVQIGAGNTGIHALRALIDHPELELVGLGMRSAARVGQDAGALAGVGPVGVVATDDIDALIRLKPDCVCFMAGDFTHGVGRSAAPLIDTMCQFLRDGSNIVSTTMSGYVHPPSIPEHYRTQLENACREGQSTYIAVGIDPGFMGDALVLLLSGFSKTIRSVKTQEILSYDTYLVDEAIFDKLGFGRTPEEEKQAYRPGMFARAWESNVSQIADGLGVELDEITDAREVWYTPDALATEHWQIHAGTVAAIVFKVFGVVAGEKRITFEHVTRLEKSMAPDWPQPPGRGGYRVEIDGLPAITAEIALDEPGGDANIAALMATGMRAVNALPLVCQASPGVKSWFDFPHVIGRNVFE